MELVELTCYVCELGTKIDPYLCRNVIKYINRHKQIDAMEIILHFININNKNMLIDIMKIN